MLHNDMRTGKHSHCRRSWDDYFPTSFNLSASHLSALLSTAAFVISADMPATENNGVAFAQPFSLVLLFLNLTFITRLFFSFSFRFPTLTHTHMLPVNSAVVIASAAKTSDFSDSVRFLKALPKTGPKKVMSEKQPKLSVVTTFPCRSPVFSLLIATECTKHYACASKSTHALQNS